MAGPTPVEASAPGKVILLGEHAVVYGEPSLSFAINRRLRVAAEPGSPSTTVNGDPLDAHRHAYMHQAIQHVASRSAFRLRTESELPSASGIGSSAALSVATVAALLRLLEGKPPLAPRVAQLAFETEFLTQGAASPNDTTVSTAGGGVLLAPSPEPGLELLWRLDRNERTWMAHRVVLPPLPLVVAHSGQRSRTADQVAKVRRFVERDPSARDLLREIGTLTREGVQRLRQNDWVGLGALMDRNHECLHALGVDTPQLERLARAARGVGGTYGAKLTGAGGGGSLIVLAEDPRRVRAVLEAHGAQAFVAEATPRGLEVTA